MDEHTPERYRPSNGSEGADFIDRWCAGCRRDTDYRRGDGDSCKIVADTMAYDEDDPRYPVEWTYAADDTPYCAAFEPVEDVGVMRDQRQAVLAVIGRAV